ncbi:MAG TPA: class I SAM-dependent methyltransferase [Candidatus Saccharimonadales bacterium]|nr:class I SAM-dependent methyltransferase [Candidatus Saccharimonadales bacterium]
MMAKKKSVKKKEVLVDDKEYWKERHAKTANLKASGVKSVGVKSNEYIYRILADQYLKLLRSLDLKDVKTVLDCGFGDGYFLRFYQSYFPQFNIFGVDISADAKNKIDFVAKSKLYTSDLTKFNSKKKFDIVHSFDVMYHILKSEDYVKTLNNMANLSNKYIILHERFLTRAPLVSSKHVRMRRSEFTNQVLNSKGFYLHEEIPTHFLAMRMFTYKFNKVMPHSLYRLDKFIADNIHPSAQEFLASHHIRVYARAPEA